MLQRAYRRRATGCRQRRWVTPAAEIAFAVVGTYLIVSGTSYFAMVVELALVPFKPFDGKAQAALETARWASVVGAVITVLGGVGLVTLRKKLAARFTDEPSSEDERDWVAGAREPQSP